MMNGEGWACCSDADRMLAYLRRSRRIQPSKRKYRLFACATCRCFWNQISETCQRAVEASERYADGRVKVHELRDFLATAEFACYPPVEDGYLSDDTPDADMACLNAAHSHMPVAKVASHANFWACRILKEPVVASLIRHIFGNPFRPLSAPDQWPTSVIQLAAALYEGQDCSFALHDALLEAGHPELADHFREKDHPKCCCVLDLILGKS